MKLGGSSILRLGRNRPSMTMPPSSWDPLRIVLQIIALQAIYYIGMIICALLFAVSPPFVWSQSSDWLFNVDYVDIQKYPSYTIGCLLIYSPIWMSIWIVSVVGKARHCWDFAATILFYHWLFTWHHELSLSIKFSFTYTWWIVHILSTLLTTLISERLSLYYELQPIIIPDEWQRTRIAFTQSNPFRSFFISIYIKFSSILGIISSKVGDIWKRLQLLFPRILAIKRVYRQGWRIWSRQGTGYSSVLASDPESCMNDDSHNILTMRTPSPVMQSGNGPRVVTHPENLNISISSHQAQDQVSASTKYSTITGMQKIEQV